MRTIIGSAALLTTLVVLLAGVASGARAAGSSSHQAPVGHRQPTAQDVQSSQEDTSADETMKKIDEDLDRKLKGICRGC
jgi:hypothetical protein